MSVIWEDMNWKKIHYRVLNLQKRIAKSTLDKDWANVDRLQHLALNSYYAKLSAVRRVTTQSSKRTSGLDGKFWWSDSERFDAVNKLDYRTYEQSPFKRVYIPKDHDRTKTRPLSVPIIYDRAMQALCMIALDPVVETLAEPHSYGFRPFRSAQMAIRDICNNFDLMSGNNWLVKADVSQCFDHISHSWLLDNLPFDKKLMRRILKCGYVYDNRKIPTNEGMPQGGVLSPTVVTFTLTGMERILDKCYPESHIVRFADDFLFSSPSKQEGEEILEVLRDFLSKRNLTLSTDKTGVKSAMQGVEFLGWNIRTNDKTIVINPTKLARKETWQRILYLRDQSQRWSLPHFIERINDNIVGWGNYHMYGCRPDAGVTLDEKIENMVWTWIREHNLEMTPNEIRDRYWIKDDKTGERRFKYGQTELMKLQDLDISLPVNIDLSKNAYLDRKYFREWVKLPQYSTDLYPSNIADW